MDDPTQDIAEKPLAPEHPDNVDPELASWLNRFEAFQMTMDVTLTVGGFLISGTPQSTAEFYRALGLGFDEAMTRARVHGDDGVRVLDLRVAGEKMRGIMEKVATEYDVAKPGSPTDDDDAHEKAERLKEEILNVPRQHVRLKDVVILTPSGQYINTPYWRGRLSHVSGWYIGRPSDMQYEGDNA